VESETELGGVAAAQSQLDEVDAAIRVGSARLAAADGALNQAIGALSKAEQEFETRKELFDRGSGVVSEREIETLENNVVSAQGAVDAARSNRDAVQAELEQVLPAQRVAAQAALQQAQVALEHTAIVAGVSGRIEQFALQVGDFVSPVLRPAGILVPNDGHTGTFQAGFSQLAGQVLHVGMAAEMTCMSQPFRIIQMRITAILPQVAAGQFRPTDNLIDFQALATPGLVQVSMEPLWPELIEGVLPGSSCMAMAYTVAPHGSGAFMHVVETVGVVHAAGLRIRALLLPVQTLVFSGGH